MTTDTGGPALCKWCDQKAYALQGHIWLCSMHYRFQQMRVTAKRKGKTVPSYRELEILLGQTFPFMACSGCGKLMNWHGYQGPASVISLQHDRNGRIRFLCRSCNTRHAFCEGDNFYLLPKGYKYCSRCKSVKPLCEFHYDKYRFDKHKSCCKECQHQYYLRRKAMITEKRRRAQ